MRDNPFAENSVSLDETPSPLVRRRWSIVLSAGALTACTLLVLPLTSELKAPAEKKLTVRRFASTVFRRKTPRPPAAIEPPAAAQPVPSTTPPIPPSPKVRKPEVPIDAAGIPFEVDIPIPDFSSPASPAFEVRHDAGRPAETYARATGDVPGAFELHELDTPPRPLTQVQPVYPYGARRRGREGFVDVRFTVTSRGNVHGVQVVDAEPTDVFDEAARRAVRKWRFSPPIRNGVPVAARLQMRIRFELEN